MKNNFAANLFSNLFSITDYGETHYIMRVFGIKIKFLKREFALKKKQSPYYYYKKNNIDITTLPPATGRIREIQLANLELLKELDYVCRQNNLKYWLDFGTLLGAVRHKGYIPWDDDIDTSMLREDYDKIIDAFKETGRNPDIFADYAKGQNNPCQYYIKVQHKKCPHLFVDIFPYDYYGQKLSIEEQLKKTNEIKRYRKYMQKQCEKNQNEDFILNVVNEARDKILCKNTDLNSSDLVWGIDFNHCWENWFYSYDMIFPHSEINFEGEMFPCPNRYKEVLTQIFGDYMGYPEKIGVGHSMYADLDNTEKTAIKAMI